ncbi:arylsulfatase [Campylobacter jejuni]|uniref:arylsulfatase n=1 Tax=Campylobacter jejuni TaxID=197 RepID=UPI0009A84D34|nr:arylsulfatase [Campylobacter jejuni]
MAFNLSKGVSLEEPKPKIDEFNWGAKEPSVQIQFSGSGTGYQAMPFSVDQAFNPKK